MTDAQREYFDAMESLFGSLGWKLFVDEFSGMQSAIGASFPTIKPENLLHEQGRYEAMGQVLGFQTMIENHRKAVESEPDEDNSDNENDI